MDDLVEVFRTLGDPTRLKLYKLLTLREFCVCELADAVGVSESAVSQHLRRLKSVKLVRERRARQWVYYRADGARFDSFMEQLGSFTRSPLDEIPEMRAVLGRITDSDPASACTRRSPTTRKAKVPSLGPACERRALNWQRQ